MKSKSTANNSKSKGNAQGATEDKRVEPNEQEFPGYKPYPPEEDIMNRLNKTERVEGDLENATRSGRGLTRRPEEEGIQRQRRLSQDEMAEGAETEFKDELEENDSDLTQEDWEALGPRDLSMDLGDDEQLKKRTWPVDFAGEDLDVPGSEIDDLSESIGSEDEENNPYSLGGDRHENLEEDPSAGR